jgi:hypothetical protein
MTNKAIVNNLLDAIEKNIDQRTLPAIKAMLMDYVGKLMTTSVRLEMEQKFSEIVRQTML